MGLKKEILKRLCKGNILCKTYKKDNKYYCGYCIKTSKGIDNALVLLKQKKVWIMEENEPPYWYVKLSDVVEVLK